MLKGFRDFIARGNIVDLAVGVVVGVAFNALVTALTSDFIKPLIQLISGGKEFSGAWHIRDAVFGWGDFITQVINFILIAAALYFLVVLPMNKLAERRSALTKRIGIFRRKNAAAEAAEEEAAEEEEALPPDIALLTQIRDSLAAMEAGLPAGAGSSAPAPRTAE